MLKSIKLDNGENYSYREVGENDKIILLIHGNMTSSKHWDVVVEKLKHAYHVYALDLRGFGRSTYHQKINSLKDFSEDIKLFVDKLGLKNFSLVGWSAGGAIAMCFAIDYPEYVKKLILIGSVGIKGYPMFRKNEDKQSINGEFLKTKEEIAREPIQVAPVLNALKNRDKAFYKQLWNKLVYNKNQPSEEKYEEYLDDMLTQRNPVDISYALSHFNISKKFNGVEEGSGDIERIKTSTLILQGDRDLVIDKSVAEEITKNIKSSELIILEDCGHSPMIDCLEIFINRIVKFIEK